MKRIEIYPRMRFWRFFVLMLALHTAWHGFAQEQAHSDTLGVPVIVFNEEEYQFGDVIQGEKVEHTFIFKNSGTSPLILQNVISTCGCTAPEWPKEPIAPGGEGKIRIIFNSAGKIGRQNKVVTVRSNAKYGDFSLFISAMVLPKKKGKS